MSTSGDIGLPENILSLWSTALPATGDMGSLVERGRMWKDDFRVLLERGKKATARQDEGHMSRNIMAVPFLLKVT